MKARILIVDDHQVVRDGLRFVLRQQPDMEVVGEAGNGRAALEQVETLSPDLVVMDVHMEDTDGLDVSHQVLKAHPEIKVVVLSAYPDPDFVNRAVQVGVNGYVLKSNASDQLVQAIRAVLNGKVYLCPEAAAAVIGDYRKLLTAKEEPHKSGLTNQEKTLLVLVAKGQRNKEIAAELGLSVKSVETYRSRLMKKLGCNSPAEAVRYAIREGLVEP